MIHYVVAVFTGKRENVVLNNRLSDPTYLVKKHLHALDALKIPSITRATFVISPSGNKERDNEVLDYVHEQGKVQGIEIASFVKESNFMFSYGSWNAAMERNIKNNDHFFLIEDDYFPCIDEFYKPFLQQMERTESAYVCQLWTDKFLKKRCAAISNGLMNIHAARAHYEKFGECLWLKNLKRHENSPHQGVIAQINFLDGYNRIGCTVSDVSDEYGHPFLSPENRVFMYGNNVKGIPIKCESYGEVKTEPATYLPYSKVRRQENGGMG